MSRVYNAQVGHIEQYFSTGTASIAFLNCIWGQRDQLVEAERRGFAQMIYLVIVGHLEECFRLVLTTRIQSMSFVPLQVDPQILPVRESMQNLWEAASKKYENCTVSTFKEEFALLFSKPILTVLGKDLAAALEALQAWRNIVAHGRKFRWKIEMDKNPQGILVADYTKDGEFVGEFKKMLDLLISRKLLKKKAAREVFDAVFGDDALRYFRDSALSIQEKLVDELNPDEKVRVGYYLQALPDLP